MKRSGALVAALLATSSAVHAQTWTADLYAGGTRYQALADRVSTTNLIGTLRYETLRGFLAYVSAAAPLDGDAVPWGAAGTAGRLTRSTTRPWSFGVELGADGYGFHDRISDLTGGGAALSGLPFVAFTHRLGAFELRAGWQQHVFGYTDSISGGRGLLEGGARLTTATQWYGVQLDARWLRSSNATYPFAGIQLSAAPAFLRLWAWTGRWFGDLPGTVWGLGGSVPAGPLGEAWVTFRRDASDPLYENAPRRGWNIGISRELGRRRSAAATLAPKVERGVLQIRLPISILPTRDGAPPLVAGEFNNWQPMPMRRAGRLWVLELALRPGVYRFAFVTAAGEWFVPEQYPGRMDDGMGGHVAVVVVS